ncbi:MAG: hypothetical protein ACRDI2_22290 [Chloroflexota bacterium]
MEPNALGADWELRVGSLRVYYVVEEMPEPEVDILAVGLKRGSILSIAGQRFQL